MWCLIIANLSTHWHPFPPIYLQGSIYWPQLVRFRCFYKKWLKNDWNPGTWELIWEYSARPIQWIPTWQGLDGFQKSFVLLLWMKVAVAFERLISIHSKSAVVGLFLIFHLISVIVLLGRILTVESQEMKFRNWNDGVDPDKSSWLQSGDFTTSFLFVIRVFYEVGQPLYEEIGK